MPQYKHNGKTCKGLGSTSPSVVAEYDIVIITAAHTNVDYEMVAENTKAVFDTKNVMAKIKARNSVETLCLSLPVRSWQ